MKKRIKKTTTKIWKYQDPKKEENRFKRK